MDCTIEHRSGFDILTVTFSEGEVLRAEPSSMLAMSTGIVISTAVGGQLDGGGVQRGLKSLVTGESFFSSLYTAKRSGEWLSLAPAAIGEILGLTLSHGGQGYYITSGSFLACEPTVTIAVEYQGSRGLLASKGLYLMRATGEGRIFLSSFGAIISRELGEGERIVVDNRFVVAYSDTITFELTKAARSVKDSLLSGEGLVNRYTGPGTLYYQTRGRQRSGGLLSGLLNVVT